MSKYDCIKDIIEKKIQQEIEVEYNVRFKPTLFDRVQEIIHEETGIALDEIFAESDLQDDLRCDGVGNLFIILDNIEKEFSIEFKKDVLVTHRTVQDIVNLLESKGCQVKKNKWNKKEAKNAYTFVKEYAEKANIDISNPYLNNICKKTKSNRIQALILEAYYLGQARGIIMVDDRFNKIVISNNLESKGK